MAKYVFLLILLQLTTGLIAQNWEPAQSFREPKPGVRPDDTQKPVIWRVRERVLRAGEKVDMNFRVFGFTDVAAYQFALQFDPAQLHFDSIEITGSTIPLSPDGNFGLFNLANGEIRSLWSLPTGMTLPPGTLVFRINFTALAGGKKLSEVLYLDNSILTPVAYNSVLASRDLQLYFADYTKPFDPRSAGETPAAFALDQNFPNPFEDCTTIGFSLPSGSGPDFYPVQLRVFDGAGRELLYRSGAYPAGNWAEQLCLDEVSGTGVLYYQLTTPLGMQTRRMVFVGK